MNQPSIKKNFIMNVILTLSSVIFPLITFPYASRILLPEGTGRVNFAISLISYFDIFAQLGIPIYGIRAVAQVRDDKEKMSKVVQELLIINICTMLLSYAALAAVLFTVPRLFDDRTLFFIISATLLLNCIGMEWMYKGLEQYTYITVRSVIFKFIALIAMFLLIHTKEDYVMYGAVSILAASASNVLNFLNAHKYISFHKTGKYDFKKHLKPVFVFFAMSCATTIYTNLDNVMLGWMATNTDVGYYGAAVKIKTVLVSCVTSLGAVLLPRASYFIEHQEMDEFRRISKKALQFVFFIAFPLMLYFILFAKQSIFFLSGDAYAGAIVPMQIIMPTLLFIGITNIFGIQILVPLGREKTVLISEIGGAVTDFVLNMILIPHYQAAGAAIGTLCAEAVVLLIQYIALRKEMSEIFHSIKVGSILLSLIGAAAAGLLLSNIVTGNFIVLLVTACAFFFVYFIIMMACKDSTAYMLFDQVKRIVKRH